MKRYVVPLCTNKLPLGRMGENKATEIVFNISEWRAAYGDGTVVLLHKRHKDIAPYPATTTVDGDTVTWLVTNVDTAQMGCGSAEMQYVIGDIVVKSVVWITSVLPSLGDPVDVPDTPPQNWMAQLRETVAEKVTAPVTAKVGQTIRVKSVDKNGRPTEWEATDTVNKALHGKTVVCFGDSLIGMYRGDDSCTAFLAEHTGATVYNVGFGGCRMAVHPTTGYAAFSMWALAKAITENDWTSQDEEAASGSDYFPDQLAVLKGIDFSAVNDVIIHYGTNDFTGRVTIDDESDPDDCMTVCGALRYSLDKLQTAYPNLRIFISLPVFRYWTADNGIVSYPDTYTTSIGNTLLEVRAGIGKVAKEYNLPIIDGYGGMGVNKRNAATFLSDGTHHTVAGRERFGVFLGACLIAQGAVMAEFENAGGGSSSGGTTTYTNQIPISTDTNGSIFNDVGYQAGYRLSSSGGTSSESGMYVTGFIPVKYLDWVYLQNVGYNSVASTASNQRIALYDTDKNFIITSGANATSHLSKEYDLDNNLIKFRVVNVGGTDVSGAAYFRICGNYIGTDSVITVNEEIV